MKTRTIKLLIVTLLTGLAHAETTPPPNVIVILADDLGYGELGCYGQKLIRTPRLDRMAAEGLRFTQFYAGATVCAPSRCVLMTGQHTGRCQIRGNGTGSKQALDADSFTVAKMYQQAGYETGLIGKWGLGDHLPDTEIGLPNRQGFDSFFGYTNQTHAHNYYPEFLWRNEKKIPLRNEVQPSPKLYGKFRGGAATKRVDYSHDLFAAEALKWVRENRKHPFFLYLALTIPHANNEGTLLFKNGAEVPDITPYGDEDWPVTDKSHAAMITRMDADIGRLLDLLGELQIAENTLVIFTSDNGHHNESGHDPRRFAPSGALRGMKRQLYEGGIRVPTIAWWPGTVTPSVSDHIGYFGDLMATGCELTGQPVPDGLHSVSLLPTLKDRGEGQQQHDYLYWDFYESTGARALRKGNWKVVRPQWNAPTELYYLPHDLSENDDVATQNPEVVKTLEELMEKAYQPSPDWLPPSK